MNSPDKTTPPRNADEGARVLWRGASIVAALFSAFAVSHAVLMTVQYLNAEIPPGRIVSIGSVKSGPLIQLDNGQRAVVPWMVLRGRPTPIVLHVGDRVEKHVDSAVYSINGTPVTDRRWLIETWLLPWDVCIGVAAYLVLGCAFAIRYRRTPIGDALWSGSDPQRPVYPRTTIGCLVMVVVPWLFLVIAMMMVFSCMGQAVGGLFRAIPTR
jgi:hypothetical protein